MQLYLCLESHLGIFAHYTGHQVGNCYWIYQIFHPDGVAFDRKKEKMSNAHPLPGLPPHGGLTLIGTLVCIIK